MVRILKQALMKYLDIQLLNLFVKTKSDEGTQSDHPMTTNQYDKFPKLMFQKAYISDNNNNVQQFTLKLVQSGKPPYRDENISPKQVDLSTICCAFAFGFGD